MKNKKQETRLEDLKSKKNALVEKLVQRNLKGGLAVIGCPPPIGTDK
jgi:hypothetical protein